MSNFQYTHNPLPSPLISSKLTIPHQHIVEIFYTELYSNRPNNVERTSTSCSYAPRHSVTPKRLLAELTLVQWLL